MKNHTIARFVALSTFCALATLPALAVPTGTLTSHRVIEDVDFSGRPQMVATIQYAASNDNPFTAYIDFGIDLGSTSPNPDDHYSHSVAQFKLNEIGANENLPPQTAEIYIPKLGPNWVYTSNAVLVDYSRNPEVVIASSTASN